MSWVSVFAEYAKYKWGPTSHFRRAGRRSRLLGPIEKPGYYMGAQLDVPVGR